MPPCGLDPPLPSVGGVGQRSGAGSAALDPSPVDPPGDADGWPPVGDDVGPPPPDDGIDDALPDEPDEGLPEEEGEELPDGCGGVGTVTLVVAQPATTIAASTARLVIPPERRFDNALLRT